MSYKLEDLLDVSKYPRKMKVKSVNRLQFVKEIDDNSIMYTPEWVAEQMLDLLPTEIWSDPNATFLDPCCKSGVFLEKIYWRLIEGLKDVMPSELDRSTHILTKQLYGLALSNVTAENARIVLYGTYRADHRNAFTTRFDTEHGNILPLHIINEKETYSYKDVVGDRSRQLVNRILRKGLGKEMKFDVVIGNPPYNRGVDLDFVNLGFDLCKKYCVMITPAKWQTAADDYRGCASKTIDYKGFRKKLVPHMSKVVFYPRAADIFNIKQVDGIAYFRVDKDNTYDECTVENRCNHFKVFNSKVKRDIRNKQSLINIGNEIIDYINKGYTINEKTQLKFNKNDYTKKYKVVAVNKAPGLIDSRKEEEPCYITSIYNISENFSGQNDREALFSSNNKSECESFVSYMYTRMVRFLYLCNTSKLSSPYTDDCFRFVPAPPPTVSGNPWDHIYTDEELYKAFNLPQKYIDVIEAVIKERDIESMLNMYK